MDLTQPSPGASPPARPLPPWRFALAFGLGLAVWLAAGAGLYGFRSAPYAFAGYHALCLLGGYLLRSPGLPAAHRLYPLDRRHLLAAVVGANSVAVILYTLVGAVILNRGTVLSLLEQQGLPPSSYLYLFPYFAVVNPLVEEFFWRGGVYATLRHLFKGWVRAALATSVLFGAWHWLVLRLFLSPIVAVTATIAIMGIGFALTWVYERTRRLAYSVILHALAGDMPLLLVLLLVSRK